MTENEAIRRCDLLINGYSVSCSTNDAFKDENKGYMTFETMREFAETCKQALEEIQQYRVIGTVEDFKNSKIIADERYDYLFDKMEVFKQYASIGTIDEFKALKEKSVAKKVVRLNDNGYYDYKCPTCGMLDKDCMGKKYCNCGQALET